MQRLNRIKIWGKGLLWRSFSHQFSVFSFRIPVFQLSVFRFKTFSGKSAPVLALLILVFIFLLSSFIFILPRAYAATGINHTINFQGKLVNNDGTNVADSTYSIVFSLYTVSSGGSAAWTETDSVTTKDGVFRVALGAGTSFSSASIDFNSDTYYLGIKVGSDAEMTPRVQFAAVPYAFNAEKVNGLTVTNNGGNTLNIAANKTLTANNSITLAGTDGKTFTINNSLTFSGTDGNTFTFPNASGSTVCVSGQTCATSGTVGYFQRTASGGLNYLSPSTTADLLSIGATTGLTNAGLSVAVNSLGNAAAYIENTGGAGDILTASSAGATKFTINKNGDIVLGTTTRITNAGVGTFITGTVIGSQTFTTNNIADSASLTIKSGGSGTLTLDTAGNQQINIGNTNANAIALGNSGQNTTLTLTGTGLTTLGGNLTVNGQTTTLGNGSDATVQTKSGSNTALNLFSQGSSNVVLGQNAGNGTVLVQPNAGGQASLIVKNQGSGDLLTASAGATTKFQLDRNGNIFLATGANVDTLAGGALNIGATNATSLTLGRGSSETLSLTLGSDATGDIFYRNSSGFLTRLAVGSSSQCLIGGTTPTWSSCSTAANNYFQRTASGGFTYLAPATITDNLSIGATTGLTASGLSVKVNSLGNAAAYVENTGTGDIFTASSAGTTKFVIDKNGNVGVGTTTPAEKLQIAGGNIELDNNQFIAFKDNGGAERLALNWTSANNLQLLNGSSTGNIQIGLTNLAGLITLGLNGQSIYGLKIGVSATVPTASVAANTNFAGFVVDNSGNGDLFTASSSGLNRFVITQSGNVGIGTSTPSNPLQLNASSSTSIPALNLTTPTSGSGDTEYLQINNRLRLGYFNGVDVLDDNGFGKDISLKNNGFDRLYIGASNGQVGINTGSQAAILDVRGIGNTTLSQTIPVASFSGKTNFASLVVDNDSSTGDLFTASASSIPVFTINTNGNLVFGNTNAGTLSWTGRTASRTITLPDATGTVCLSGQSCATSGTVGYFQRTASGAFNYLSPATTADLLSIGQTTGLTATGLSVKVNSLGNAAGYIENTGSGDLFTASAAGATKFVINNNGTATFTPGSNASNTIAIGTPNGESGMSIINSSARGDVRFDGTTLKLVTNNGIGAPTSTNGININLSGNVGIGNTNPGALLDVSGNATVSGNLSFYGGSRTIQAMSNNNLTIGGSSTGSIILDTSQNANGYVTIRSSGSVGGQGGLRFDQNSANYYTMWTTGTGTAGFNSSLNFGYDGSGNSNVLMDLSGNGTLSLGTGNSLDQTWLSITGNTARASEIISQTGTADIFAASHSATTEFVINNNGNFQFVGNSGFLNTISTTGSFASGQTYSFPNTGGTVCISGQTCASSGTVGYFQRTAVGGFNYLAPATTADLLSIGGTTGLTASGLSVKVNSLGNAAGYIENTGTGDIFTASSAGTPKFTINKNGDVVLGTTTRITSAGVGTFITGTAIGSQTFTTNNILDSGALTIKSASGNALTLDTNGGTAAVNIGNTNATSLVLGNATNNPTLTLNGTGLTTLGGNLTINGTTENVGNGSSYTIQTSSNAGLNLLSAGSGNITLGQNTGNGTVVVQPNAGGQASLIVAKQGANGDLFTASVGATTKFVINNNGNIQFTGNSGFLNTISTTGSFASGQTYNFPNAGGTICISGQTCAASGTVGYWTRNSSGGFNYLSPATTADLLSIGQTTGLTATGLNVKVNSLGNAAAYVENSGGSGDIFTASSAGSAKFVIDKSGNVGIGKTTPTSALFVSGTPGTSLVTVQDNVTGGALTLGSNGSGQTIITWGSSGEIDGSNGNFNINPTSKPLVFEEGGTEKIRMDTNGNLGIGTTNPGALLDVGAVTTNLSNSGFRVGFNSKGNATAVIDNTGGSGDIFTASSSGTPEFNIDKFGNVFIYNNQLISQISNGAGAIYIKNFSGSNGEAQYVGNWFSSGQWGIGPATGGVSDNIVRIGNSNSAGTWAGTQNLNLLIGGNIGIGNGASNTAPGATVDVNGNISVKSSSANALVVGPNGATNPGLNVDASTGSSATGLNIKSAAAGGGLALSTISSGTNENLTIDAKGSGTVTIGGTSTGAIILGTSTNGLTFSPASSGPTYNGTARPTKQIVLSAEYAGATLTASGSASINGNMTSDASPSASLGTATAATPNTYSYENYYQWAAASSGSDQQYTIAVRVTLPKDFSAWVTGTSPYALTIDFNTAFTNSTLNHLDAYIYQYGDTSSKPIAFRTNQVSGTSKNWTQVQIQSTDLTNGSVTWDSSHTSAMIFLTMHSTNTPNYVQVGDITLNYLAKF